MNVDKKEKLLQFFYTNPTKEIHLRGLARQLHLSAPWILKLSKILVDRNLIAVWKDKEKNLTLFKANRDNSEFTFAKRLNNLYRLKTSSILSYLEEQYGHPEAIILFGSYAKGEDWEESDIDLAVVTSRHLKLDLSFFEKYLNRKINLLELEKEKIENGFWSTLANGIILSGYLEIPL
ncbi:nucleotidyltransferase domain-containing protein [Candidatus Woesearchaeota archaeon]|nr:nucleotidyltransferase domain-containing protein [Candidatus Woesearchaeota archaeon]